jgi:tight adherence protein C
MSDWIELGSIFLVVFTASFLVVRRLSSTGRRIDERLRGSADEATQEERPLILGDLTEPLGNWSLAGNGKKKAELEQELREAGYYRPTALVEYAGVRTLLIAAPLIAAVVLALTTDDEVAPWALGAGVFFALLGYSLPRAFINYRAKQRGRQIERGLPVAVDLLSLCLTGGQNFLTALARVAQDLEFAFPILAQELRIVHKHAQMAGLELALQNFANRTSVPEVKNLAVMLTHVERLGTDIAAALLEFSTNFRQSMRLRAETYANRVSFWVLFPTILCLLVPGLLLFYAPLLHEASRIRAEIREDMQKNQKSLQKLERLKTNSSQ